MQKHQAIQAMAEDKETEQCGGTCAVCGVGQCCLDKETGTNTHTCRCRRCD